ncbi:hypothetical protein Ahy_B08g089011 [Arachis hypogaea]|uniref:WDR36/Utp21 N-terminal domain-containing protein n=1 Tax=Arachis hypogaea TaxID=3818 RepID=A0A444XWF2_ARAHY|nr:hypothetical protein Ahy_B08g089011 [Arachis hypogaea]
MFANQLLLLQRTKGDDTNTTPKTTTLTLFLTLLSLTHSLSYLSNIPYLSLTHSLSYLSNNWAGNGKLVVVDSNDQTKLKHEDQKFCFITIRRLAQNYEAARKSQLRKKDALLLSKFSPKIAAEPIEAERLYDVVNVVLSLQVATWSKHGEKVKLLLLFGDHVISVDIHGNMFLWEFKEVMDQNPSPFRHILLDRSFSPSCIMHPDTYLNKVLVGSEQGLMHLWNISTKKKIFEFKGWNSPITCCVSSPALDVVAVGCADGSIHVHNIRYDEELVTFTHSTRGFVTALSFCTD